MTSSRQALSIRGDCPKHHWLTGYMQMQPRSFGLSIISHHFMILDTAIVGPGLMLEYVLYIMIANLNVDGRKSKFVCRDVFSNLA